MSQDTGANRPVSPVIAGATTNKDRTLLIADDDAAFRNRIARALELRGFIVTSVGSVAEALAQTARPPAFAVLDLRLGDGNGLELVGPLRQARPDIRIVVLTGYGNIATAVAAVKEGAVDYLAKPADADVLAAGDSGARVRLTLRNPLDEETRGSGALTLTTVMHANGKSSTKAGETPKSGETLKPGETPRKSASTPSQGGKN